MYGKFATYNKYTGRIHKVTTGVRKDILRDLGDDDLLVDIGDLEGHASQYKVDLDTGQLVPTEPPKSIMDVVEAIRSDADDSTLDTIIGKIPDVTDVNKWRLENYHTLRYNSYPPIEEYIDAQVKMSDSKRKTKGETQLSQYHAKCIKVKNRFPREEVIKK